MPYTDQGLTFAGSAELMFNGLFDEPSGSLARTLPRNVLTNSVAALATTGVVAARLIPLPAGLVVTNIQVLIGGTAASGPTHFWAGLTDAQLNVLTVSADQGAAAQAANTAIKVAMGIPFVIPQTGPYYIVVSSSASTTAPTLVGMSLISGVAGMAPVLCGTAGTQAAPPAVGAQLASGTVTSTTTGNYGAWIS